MDEVEEVVEVKEAVAKIYPMVEEMTFRAIIKSEKEGYEILRAVQILINELGSETIVQLINKVEQKPQLLQKAKSMLPYLGLL